MCTLFPLRFRPLSALALGLVFRLAVHADATAHGGIQRGPTDLTQRELTGGCLAQETSRNLPLTYGDETTWDNWWSFNQERFLAQTRPPVEEAVRARIALRLRALTADPSADVAARALMALARVESTIQSDPSPELVTTIAHFVADPRCYATTPHGTSAERADVWQAAVLSLGNVGGDAAVAHLIELATDTEAGRKLAAVETVSDTMRATAVYALGVAASRSNDEARRRLVVRGAVELLEKSPAISRDVQIAAVNALGIVPLPFVANSTDESAVWASRQAQIAFLSKLLANANVHYRARAHAPIALARLLDGAPDALRIRIAEQMLPVFGRNSRENDEVWMGCVIALGLIGDCDSDAIDDSIRVALVAVSVNADQQSKNLTNIALGQIGGRAGQGEDVEKGRASVQAHLLDQLTKGRSHMRPWAALGLGILERDAATPSAGGPSVALGALRAELKDEYDPERICALALALGIARDAGAVGTLRAKFESLAEPHARGYIALALGMLGGTEALGEIRAFLDAPTSRPVRSVSSAILGIGLLGGDGSTAFLLENLAAAKKRNEAGALAMAIASTGDPRAIDALLALTSAAEATGIGRAFAASALGMLADPRPLTWNEVLSANVNYRAWSNPLTTHEGAGVLDQL